MLMWEHNIYCTSDIACSSNAEAIASLETTVTGFLSMLGLIMNQ